MRVYEHKLHLATMAFALAALWICGFSHLGALGLVGADEPRYAFVARSMAATGDWVTPRLYDQPWFEKPILYYWETAAFFRVPLHSARWAVEWGARLPSALGALLATLAMAWTARRIYGARAGYLTLLVLPSSAAFIGFSRSASPDMSFTAALAVALAGAAVVCIPPLHPLERNRSRMSLDVLAAATAPRANATRINAIALVVFGAALGIATLAKGPAAVILAAGSLGCWAIASGQWRRAFRLAHPIAIFVYCIIALPWYVICARRNPDFIRVFIFQHNFERYLTPVFQHRQPLWYFVPILLVGLFPWTVLLAWMAADARGTIREKRWRDSPGLFLGCWAAFTFVFFSLSQSKLPGYILPAVPSLALLISAAIDRCAARPDRCRWTFIVLGGCWLAGAASSFAWWNRIPSDVMKAAHLEIVILVAAFGIAGVVVLSAGLTGEALPATMVTVLATALILEFVNVRVIPKIDPVLTARSAAAQVSMLGIPDASLSAMHLQREWQYGLNFYLGVPPREWERPLTNKTWVPPFLFLDRKDLAAQKKFYPDLIVLSDRSPHAILVRLTPVGLFAPFVPPHKAP